MQNVGVIVKVRWDSPSVRSDSYSQNIDYITRGLDSHEKEEVIEWNNILEKIKKSNSTEDGFGRYLDYMERKELDVNGFKTKKSSVLATDNGYQTKSGKEGLFDSFNDIVGKDHREFYKKKFDETYKKGGLLWKPIISFDNDWLKEQGILSGNIVDEEKLKLTTRHMMSTLLKENSLENNSYWVAQLHYDTDNIHIHIAMIEKNPVNVTNMTREEEIEHGFFPNKSIKKMKSTCVRELANRDNEKKQIHDITRVRIIKVAQNTKFREDYQEVFRHLSQRLSTYNYQNLKPYEKKWIKELSKDILEKYFSSEYQKFIELTTKEQDFYRRAYGDQCKDLFESYMENCEKDLMKRLSNTILKQIKEYKDSGSSGRANIKELQNIIKVEKDNDFLFNKINVKEQKTSQNVKDHKHIKKERELSRSFSYKNTNHQSGYQLNRLNYQVNKLKREMERSVNKALMEYEKLLYKQNIEREGEYDGR